MVFHFNKAHLTDETIPMWVLKAKGETYYVNHVECNIPWSTKETPDNPSTKGSIKVKNCLLQIDSKNHATLNSLTTKDRLRLNKLSNPVKAITKFGTRLREILVASDIDHGTITELEGSCSPSWYVVELYDEKDLFFLTMSMDGIRKLMPNEPMYSMKGRISSLDDLDDLDDDDE